MKNFLTTLLLLAIPISVSAATFQAEEELSLSVPINDDLYAGGGTVTITDAIAGDLLVVGGEVTIDSSIEEDLVLIGGKVFLDGNIGDDARIVAGEVRINVTTGDDMVVLAGDVIITESTIIKGDLRIAAGKVRVYGTIRGNVYIRASEVTMNGTVSGTTDISADSISYGGWTGKDASLAANDLTITNASVINGDLRYWQPQGEYYFGGVTVEGEKLFDDSLSLDDFGGIADSAKSTLKVALLGIAGYWMLSSIFIMVLMILITKSYFVDAEKRLRAAPWMSMWYGIVYLFVTPVIIGIVFMSMIGIPVALFMLVMYIFGFVFIKPMASILLATWIARHYKKKLSKPKLLLLSIGMYVAIQVGVLVPFIGPIAHLMVILTTFGVLAQVELKKFNKVR